MPLERDINIAVNGPFWVEVANPEHPFTAMLISRSRGTCLIENRPDSSEVSFHGSSRPPSYVPELNTAFSDQVRLVLCVQGDSGGLGVRLG